MGALTSLQVDAAISYLIAIIVPALDAIVPVLPSEAAVIALGVATAGSTDPRIALLVAAAAAGAFLGDNLSYLIGRRFGPAAERRFFSTPKGKAAKAWAQTSLERFGTQLIIGCRFIPGGRTAVTLTCGLTGYPRQAVRHGDRRGSHHLGPVRVLHRPSRRQGVRGPALGRFPRGVRRHDRHQRHRRGRPADAGTPAAVTGTRQPG